MSNRQVRSGPLVLCVIGGLINLLFPIYLYSVLFGFRFDSLMFMLFLLRLIPGIMAITGAIVGFVGKYTGIIICIIGGIIGLIMTPLFLYNLLPSILILAGSIIAYSGSRRKTNA